MYIELFYFMLRLRMQHVILVLSNINAITPDLITGVNENICTFMRVRCSLYYISLGADAPQCICEALQKCFISPRTGTDLFTARPTDVEDENARRLRIVWFDNRRLKILY